MSQNNYYNKPSAVTGRALVQGAMNDQTALFCP